MAQDISVEGFKGIVNNMTANNYFTFVEEEIPIEGREDNRALRLSVKCMDHIKAKVLIDNGSSLNIIPKSTLEKLAFNASHLKPRSMVVRAFDKSHREVRGEIDLPVQIGPHTCQVTFQVMDTVATYPSAGGRRVTRGMRVPRKKYARSRHQLLFEENVEKTGKDAIYELLSERFGSCIYARGRY